MDGAELVGNGSKESSTCWDERPNDAVNGVMFEEELVG